MRPSKITAMVIAAASIWTASCSSGDSAEQSATSITSEQSSTPQSDPTESTTAASGSTPPSTELSTTTRAPPAVTSPLAATGVAAPAVTSATTAVGERPTFTWATVEGAAEYVVTVTGTDGVPLWAWRGVAAEVPLGAGLIDGEEGPRLAGSATIDAFAVDASGMIVAASGPVPISV